MSTLNNLNFFQIFVPFKNIWRKKTNKKKHRYVALNFRFLWTFWLISMNSMFILLIKVHHLLSILRTIYHLPVVVTLMFVLTDAFECGAIQATSSLLRTIERPVDCCIKDKKKVHTFMGSVSHASAPKSAEAPTFSITPPRHMTEVFVTGHWVTMQGTRPEISPLVMMLK